jgi:hypothetical protein
MALPPAGLAADIDRVAGGIGMIAIPALVLSPYLMICFALVRFLQTTCRTEADVSGSPQYAPDRRLSNVTRGVVRRSLFKRARGPEIT